MDTSFAELLEASAPQAEPSHEAMLRARAAALVACAGVARERPRWTRNPSQRAVTPRRTRREQNRLRSFTLVTVAAFIGVLVATPAFGIGNRLLDLIQGTPAPPAVQTHFAATDAMRTRLFAYAEEAGAKMHGRFSPVIAAEARGVFAIEAAEGPIYLWAAPTEDGRQCWLMQTGAESATGRPYGLGGCDDQMQENVMRPETWWTAERPSAKIVHVRVYDDAITRVEVEFEGAPAESLPVASGHALGTIPKDARVLGVVGRNKDAEELARATIR